MHFIIGIGLLLCFVSVDSCLMSRLGLGTKRRLSKHRQLQYCKFSSIQQSTFCSIRRFLIQRFVEVYILQQSTRYGMIGKSNVMQQSTLCNSNVLQQSKLCNSNVQQQATLCNSNVLQQSMLCNSNVLQQSMLCNSNVLQQSMLCNSNVLQQSMLFNSNVLQQSTLCNSNVCSS